MELAGPAREGETGISEEFIPEKYFNRQVVRNMIEVPLLSKKKMLAINMIRVDAALDRGHRAGFARLAAERAFLQREWLD